MAGMLVVDLSSGVGGSYCTCLLAGLGARVIKVEEPERGDVTRGVTSLNPSSDSLEQSALFHHLNGGKESVCLELESARERKLLRGLIRRARVVVESFAPGRMAELGLGYGSLAAENPGLVMVSISGFGQTGPYRDYLATNLVGLAVGGLLYPCGEPGCEPFPLGGFQAEYLGGLTAAVAALAALHRAERSGVGEWVDISIMESVVSALEGATVDYSRRGEVRRRQGNRHGRSYPMALLPCRDGHVGVMTPGDGDWDLFARLAGLGELLDSRFQRGEERWRLAGEIEETVRPYLMARTRQELYSWAQEVRLPFAMVLSPRELLDDPQHRARGFFSSVEHPVAGEVLRLGPPFHMSDSPWCHGRAPMLGEHTADVVEELVTCQRDLDGPYASGGGVVQAPLVGIKGECNPLDGIRVVDLTSVWAGPLCTRILADLGAEVVKVEAPARPDGTRGNPGHFTWLNRNKLGVTLDLNQPREKELFRQLVAASDVVVENFSPRVMGNFGLDYERLRGVKKELIMLSMPAYGSGGPYAHHVAYGPGLEASSGLAAITGAKSGGPLLSGSAYGDPVAGLHGAVAVLAALLHRRRTGRGQWIELAQREALARMFGEAFLLAARGLEPAEQEPLFYPHGCFRCRGEDRWLAIDVRSEAEWRRLCEAIGKGWMTEDPDFRDPVTRKEKQARLREEIQSWTLQRDPHEAMRLLQKAGVPAGAVMDARDLCHDPHLAARGFFLRMVDLGGNPCDFPGLGWSTVPDYAFPRRPAPRLGEHNRVVLKGLPDQTDDLDGVAGRRGSR